MDKAAIQRAGTWFEVATHFQHVSDGSLGVLLDTRRGKLWGLNATGNFLWICCKRSALVSERQMQRAVMRERGYNDEVSANTVRGFFEQMLSHGALKPSKKRRKPVRAKTEKPETREVSDQPLSIVVNDDTPSFPGVCLGLLLLWLVRMLMLFRFGWMYSTVKRWPCSPMRGSGDAAIGNAYRSVRAASLYIPHRAMCLERSAALTLMLRLAGVPAVFCVGCRLTPFGGHAWVEVDGRPINQHIDVHGRFLVLSRI